MKAITRDATRRPFTSKKAGAPFGMRELFPPARRTVLSWEPASYLALTVTAWYRGPIAERFRGTPNPQRRSHNFADSGAELNLLRNGDSSFRSTASGIICDATRRRHFPPSDEAASAWPGLFAPSSTSAVSLARLGKACLLLGLGARWRSKAATSASNRPPRTGGRRFCPRPAIAKQLLIRIATLRG